MNDRLAAECSGLVEVDGQIKCKHGFPIFPSCKRDPMITSGYKVTPCLNENMTIRLFPETGKPKQLNQ